MHRKKLRIDRSHSHAMGDQFQMRANKKMLSVIAACEGTKLQYCDIIRTRNMLPLGKNGFI